MVPVSPWFTDGLFELFVQVERWWKYRERWERERGRRQGMSLDEKTKNGEGGESSSGGVWGEKRQREIGREGERKEELCKKNIVRKHERENERERVSGESSHWQKEEEDERRKEGRGECVHVLVVLARDVDRQTSASRHTCFHDDSGKHGGCGGHADIADQAEEAIQGWGNAHTHKHTAINTMRSPHACLRMRRLKLMCFEWY